MENLKHAKGEWVYIPEDQMVLMKNDYSKLICQMRGWGWIQQEFDNPELVQDANGKLISAAPDLLEALIEVNKMLDEIPTCSSYRPTEDHKQTLNKITNAINKATK